MLLDILSHILLHLLLYWNESLQQAAFCIKYCCCVCRQATVLVLGRC